MTYNYRFMRFPGGCQKAVTFSYDDGTKFDKPFVEILDKFGIKCTFSGLNAHLTFRARG